MKIKSSFNLLLVLLLAASFYGYYKYIIKYEDEKVIFPGRAEEISEVEEIQEMYIYFPSEDGASLKRESAILKYNGKRIDFVEKGFEAVKEKGSFVIGEEIVLRDVFFEDKNLYMNINSEFTENMSSPNKELVLIYSLVNTMTQHENIDRVKFLVDNMEVKTMGGHIKSSVFFEFDDVLLEGE